MILAICDPWKELDAVLRIRGPVLFGLWIRDPGWKKIQRQDLRAGMNIPDLIFETLVTVFRVKNPGSGMEKIESGGGGRSITIQYTCRQHSSLECLLSSSLEG